MLRELRLRISEWKHARTFKPFKYSSLLSLSKDFEAVTARRPLLPSRFPKLLLSPTAGCTSDGEGTNSSILPHQRWFHQQGSGLRSSGLLLVTRLHRQRVRTSWPKAGSGRPLHTEPDTTFYFIKH